MPIHKKALIIEISVCVKKVEQVLIFRLCFENIYAIDSIVQLAEINWRSIISMILAKNFFAPWRYVVEETKIWLDLIDSEFEKDLKGKLF